MSGRDHPAGALTVSEVAALRGATTVSVCIPARDEAATIGPIVAALRRDLVDGPGLVDEVVVADDGSTDATAAVAASAGAEVVDVTTAAPALDPRSGKGEAMWKALHAARGDVVAYLDADLEGFDPTWVARLVAPLVADPDIAFVKGHYHRAATTPGAGGRVTELVARPAVSMFHPELAGIAQPLGGEYAGRRRALEEVPFAGGYGVDLGLLVDIARGHGVASVAQVDLGVRRHRNRPVAELARQAAEVLHVALRRAGLDPGTAPLLRPGAAPEGFETRDRPPLAELRGRTDVSAHDVA